MATRIEVMISGLSGTVEVTDSGTCIHLDLVIPKSAISERVSSRAILDPEDCEILESALRVARRQAERRKYGR